MAAKKKAQFRVKSELAAFICNNRQVGPAADNMLKELKFAMIFMWQYDPHGVITKMRERVKLAPYVHYSGLGIERYAKQTKWLENTLVDKDSTTIDVEKTLYDIEQ